MQDLSLAKIEAVRTAIEAATTVQEIKGTLDAATAMKVYAAQQRVGKEIELKMVEYIIRAERKLGEILHSAKEAGQIREGNPTVAAHDSSRFTLKEAGITRDLSSRAQKISAIPSADFERKVTELKECGKLTANRVVHSGHQTNGRKPDKPLKSHYRQDEITVLHDSGMSNPQIASEVGLGERMVRDVLERVRIERSVQPTITPDMLSMTARQKLEAAIEQHCRKLTASYNRDVAKAAQEHLANTIGPMLKKQQDEARWIMKSRKGIMTRKDYGKILACLHPDRVEPALKERYADAFRLFTRIEKLLLSENESPTHITDPPKTSAEWEELKQKYQAERKAKRAARSGIQTK